MRALIRTGSKHTLHIDPSHPEPTSSTSPSYYLIRTKATALTRGELTWPEPLTAPIPMPGYDLSGVVVSVPADPAPRKGTWKFSPGDEIYAMTTFVNKGNAREVSEAHECELALKPQNMSWEEAASVPLSALSAWQGLFVHGKLTPDFEGKGHNAGKRVLVTAASGGVGIWAVQLARQAGIEVVGTCGPSNVDFVKSLGADVVLDYSRTKVLDWVSEDRKTRDFDVVLDCVGGQTLVDCWKCVGREGIMISVAEPPVPKEPEDGVAEGVEGIWFIVSENGTQLGEITQLVEQGRCRGFVDSVYQLEQWEEAFDRLEGGHARGKVILKLDYT